MSVTRLAMFAWLMVVLQIYYSDAKINPDDYYIDKPSGLRRLRINLTELSKDEIEEVRATTVYNGEDARNYCKFAGIGPQSSFFYFWSRNPNTTFLTSSQPEYWCFDRSDNVSNTCCEGEGACLCSVQNRYNCECSGTDNLIRSNDVELSEQRVSLNSTETALIMLEGDATLKLKVLANFTETASIRSEDDETLKLEILANITETASIRSEDDKPLELGVLANLTENTPIADT